MRGISTHSSKESFSFLVKSLVSISFKIIVVVVVGIVVLFYLKKREH